MAKVDPYLDGLRGWAALSVLLGHVLLASYGSFSLPKWLSWPFDGPAAVMVFFILSGFVIGLTTKNVIPTRSKVGGYLGRRALRLIPINTIGVLLAWLVATDTPVKTVLANLLFLENYCPYIHIVIPVIPANENLWSLNYEALYYILFLLIWVFHPPLKIIFALMLLATGIGWYTDILPIFIACYSAGFIFWVAGLALSWHGEFSEKVAADWFSAAMVFLVTWKLRALANLLSHVPMPVFSGPVARLYNLDSVPAGLWLVSAVGRRDFPFRSLLRGISLIIPIIGFYIKWENLGYLSAVEYWITAGAYTFAVFAFLWKPSLGFFRLLAPTGGLAFGLYAVSRPVQTLIFSHDSWFASNIGGYFLCAFLAILVSLGLAWLLEKQMQPVIKKACGIFASHSVDKQ